MTGWYPPESEVLALTDDAPALAAYWMLRSAAFLAAGDHDAAASCAEEARATCEASGEPRLDTSAVVHVDAFQELILDARYGSEVNAEHRVRAFLADVGDPRATARSLPLPTVAALAGAR